MSDKQKTLGETLKAIREKAGLAQGELAKKMGYGSPQFVSNWERGLCSLPAKKAPLFCQLTGYNQKSLLDLLLKEEKRKLTRAFGLKVGTKKAPTKKKPVKKSPPLTKEQEQAVDQALASGPKK